MSTLREADRMSPLERQIHAAILEAGTSPHPPEYVRLDTEGDRTVLSYGGRRLVSPGWGVLRRACALSGLELDDDGTVR